MSSPSLISLSSQSKSLNSQIPTKTAENSTHFDSFFHPEYSENRQSIASEFSMNTNFQAKTQALNPNTIPIPKSPLGQITLKINPSYVKLIRKYISESKLSINLFGIEIQSNCSLSIHNIPQLNEIEESAYKCKNQKIRLIVKEIKAKILSKIELSLNGHSSINITELNYVDEKKECNSKFSKIIKYIIFRFLSLMGTIIDGIGSFLGIQSALKLIFTTITSPISIVIGIFFTLVNSILFLSFEVNMLKTAMGIDSRSDIKKCLDFDRIEIEQINSIQLLLYKKSNNANKNEITQYNKLLKSINNCIEIKKHSYQEDLKESYFTKFFRPVITFLGCILVLASTYYMMSSLLVFLFSMTTITPAGWVIIGLGLLTTLAYFISMRGQGMARMFMPEFEDYKELKVKVEQLEIDEIKLINKYILTNQNERLIQKNKILRQKKPNLTKYSSLKKRILKFKNKIIFANDRSYLK